MKSTGQACLHSNLKQVRQRTIPDKKGSLGDSSWSILQESEVLRNNIVPHNHGNWGYDQDLSTGFQYQTKDYGHDIVDDRFLIVWKKKQL
ncbi:hypothetical protein GDO86_018815 [Hymenochirus boettgeri]|uniref:Uncharacterized protein n=1 Tax=Hymenochirus boettgeri TaxID=247094 RepID=A0A8T2IAT6_9PIPI|nr:hypothetical protein GDO86_018815 [Hymenochirus boettgeri]